MKASWKPSLNTGWWTTCIGDKCYYIMKKKKTNWYSTNIDSKNYRGANKAKAACEKHAYDLAMGILKDLGINCSHERIFQ